MAETVNKGKKIFADKIRMMAKSIYDAADDIAGTTDGCVEISVEFDIETETETTKFPTYTITRRHYPRKDLVDEFLKRMSDTLPIKEERPVLSIDSDPVAYKEMLDARIERAKTAALGKCCGTCKYENDIDCMECNACFRNPDLIDYERVNYIDKWEAYHE